MGTPRDGDLLGRKQRSAWSVLLAVSSVGVCGVLLVVSLAGVVLILVDAFWVNGSVSLLTWSNAFGNWDRWAALLANTGIVSGVAVAVACPAGTFLAVLLFKMRLPFRQGAIVLLMLAAALPVYVLNGALLAVVSMNSVRESAVVVGLVHGVAHLPIAAIIIGLALRTVSVEVEESALAAGRGEFKTLLFVTLRMALGGIVAAGVLILLWTATDYSVSDTLAVRTFAAEVYTQYSMEGRAEEPVLVALPLVAVFCVLLWLLQRVFFKSIHRPVASDTRLVYQTVAWRWPLSFFAVGAPLGLVVFLFAALSKPLDSLARTLEAATWFLEEVSVSLEYGAIAGAVCAAVGIGLSWLMVRQTRWRRPLVAYVILMIAIPAPVLGMGLVRLFDRPGALGWFYDSPGMLVAAYVVRFLPIAVLLLIPAVVTISVDREDAARGEGAGAVEILFKIVVPQCVPALLVVVFVVIILAFGELPCSQLITPPGYVTAAARFFSLVHYGMYPDTAVLCLLSAVSVAVPCVGLYGVVRGRLAN